jgi:hypothetical protein
LVSSPDPVQSNVNDRPDDIPDLVDVIAVLPQIAG